MLIKNNTNSISVRGTEIFTTDTHKHYREKLARIALDEMYQFVAVLDDTGTLLEVNRAALEGVGLKLPDVEGKPFWECFWWVVSTQTQERLQEAIQQVAQGEFIRYDVEIYGRASGKDTIIIDFSLIPVKDDTGKVVYMIAEGRDITEKKAFEEQIAQKNVDLQALLERIRELDEIKTQFFANVSHELRTPLALIIGPAERLMNADAITSLEVQHNTAQVIVRNAKMLLKHVNDLLDISKLEAGKLKIDLHETDVAEIIRFVASHFEILANERGVDFRVEIAASFVSFVDSEKLQRVVMNLLSNAFKFVPIGGFVLCKMETSKQDIVLSVEDSGPGVKPKLRDSIFERFRQGDGASNRQFGGTGLGLAIAHEFVAMHKGKIEVLDSHLGGALFQVNFPINHLPPDNASQTFLATDLDRTTLDGLIEELRLPVQRADNTVITGPVNKEIILVVEDNLDMNRFIAQSLSQEYQVISAFDGQEGLEKALLFHPALIVSDIMMPKFSGVQMIAELRKHPAMVEIPVIILSAKADEELKIQLLEESSQDFITKPFSERDLQVRIRNLIAVRKSNEVLREAERIKLQAVEQQVQERTKDLKELNQSLKVSNEDLQQFAHVASHDLKEPVRKIKTFGKRLQDEYQHLLPEKGNVFLNKILSATDRIYAMIDGVLSYSALTSSDQPMQTVDLNEVFVSIETDLEVLIQEKGATFFIEKLHNIEGVPVLLYQLFYNLVNNSLKFAKTTELPVITIKNSIIDFEGNPFAKIVLSDNGIGFEQEFSEKIFTTFNRLNPKDMYEGTGLGLALCKKIVHRHGGFISANGVKNQGAEFKVLLPLNKL